MAELRRLEPEAPPSPPPLYRTGFPEDGKLSAPSEAEQQARREEIEKETANGLDAAEETVLKEESGWARFKKACKRKWEKVKGFFSDNNDSKEV